jgi:hypothetical protein
VIRIGLADFRAIPRYGAVRYSDVELKTGAEGFLSKDALAGHGDGLNTLSPAAAENHS